MLGKCVLGFFLVLVLYKCYKDLVKMLFVHEERLMKQESKLQVGFFFFFTELLFVFLNLLFKNLK